MKTNEKNSQTPGKNQPGDKQNQNLPGKEPKKPANTGEENDDGNLNQPPKTWKDPDPTEPERKNDPDPTIPERKEVPYASDANQKKPVNNEPPKKKQSGETNEELGDADDDEEIDLEFEDDVDEEGIDDDEPVSNKQKGPDPEQDMKRELKKVTPTGGDKQPGQDQHKKSA